MFGGKAKAVKWWSRTFYAYHDRYLSQNQFVGKDRNLFNAVLISNPSRILTVWAQDPEQRLETSVEGTVPHTKCDWVKEYYPAYWLASPTDTLLMAEEYRTKSWIIRLLTWLGIMQGSIGGVECGLMQGWSFRNILKEAIGRTH